jgi:hypothetical protein
MNELSKKLIGVMAFCTISYGTNASALVKPYAEVYLNYRVEDQQIFVGFHLENKTSEPIWIHMYNICPDNHINSELLTINAIENDSVIGAVGYTGVLIDLIKRDAAENYLKIDPFAVVECEIKLSDYYHLNDNFEAYEIQYSRVNLAYLDTQPEFNMVSNKLIIANPTR